MSAGKRREGESFESYRARLEFEEGMRRLRAGRIGTTTTRIDRMRKYLSDSRSPRENALSKKDVETR